MLLQSQQELLLKSWKTFKGENSIKTHLTLPNLRNELVSSVNKKVKIIKRVQKSDCFNYFSYEKNGEV